MIRKKFILVAGAACLALVTSGCARQNKMRIQVDGNIYDVIEFSHPSDPSDILGYQVVVRGRILECASLAECGLQVRDFEAKARQAKGEPPVLLEQPEAPSVIEQTSPPPPDTSGPIPYKPTTLGDFAGGD